MSVKLDHADDSVLLLEPDDITESFLCLGSGRVRCGDVIHVRDSSFYGWGIRTALSSWGNHDAVLVFDGRSNEWFVVEALWKQDFVATPLEDYLAEVDEGKASLVFLRVPGISIAESTEVAREAVRWIGRRPYDKRAILSIALDIFLKVSIFPNKEWHWYCTESVAHLHRLVINQEPWGFDKPTPGTTEKRNARGRLLIAGECTNLDTDDPLPDYRTHLENRWDATGHIDITGNWPCSTSS